MLKAARGKKRNTVYMETEMSVAAPRTTGDRNEKGV